MRRLIVWCLVTMGAVWLIGSATAQDEAESANPVTLRMMTFNVLYGGDEIDFNQVIAAITAADADIVGLQEPMGNTHLIAESAGYAHADERMHIISRFPLLTPPDFDGTYIFAEVSPGNVIALSNVHLTSDPYGPYLVRDGEPLEHVLALESTLRLPEIARHMAVLPNLIEVGYPVLWTGDFNSPSHADWTEAAAESRDDIDAYAVEWNVSRTIEAMGFVDTWRVAHPDPVERRGYTWTPAEPPLVYDDEVADRIDWVLAGGSVRVISSELLGEAGNPDVDIVIDPWGSDHRAVVSEVEVIPAPPPVMISSDEYTVELGDDVTVRFQAAAYPAQVQVVMLPDYAPIGENIPVSASGQLTLPASMFPAAADYELRLLPATNGILALTVIHVLPESGIEPSISLFMENTTYEVGTPITAMYTAPGNRLDWVGVYTAGDDDLTNYWLYRYTGARVSGIVTIGATYDSYDAFPLPPGEYVLRLMLDDDYIMLAESEPFTIVE